MDGNHVGWSLDRAPCLQSGIGMARSETPLFDIHSLNTIDLESLHVAHQLNT
jgi:hypothetical protein